MSYLESKVNGHPVFVSYTFHPGCPMRITGWGFGDADPPEPDEVDIDDITNEDGVSIFAYLHESDLVRIENECLEAGAREDEAA
jgi:hypothetical protein